MFRVRSRPKSNMPGLGVSRRMISVVTTVLALVVGGVVAFLATTDMAPPHKTLEKVISDDRFPR